jgi:general nucleoside transport system permease protein
VTRNPRTGLAWYEMRKAGLALVLLFLAVSVALLIVIAGANPLRALQGLLAGSFGDRYAIAETLVQSVPIAIVALGVAPALRAGIFPVGSEGQLAIGAVTATATILAMPAAPASVALPMGCIAGILGGVVWAFVPALLRARLHVNEILSTLLMNYLAANLVLWLLRTMLGTAEQVATPRSDRLPIEALIPKLIDGTRLHWGAPAVVLIAGALAYWIRSVRGLAFDIFATHRDLAARMSARCRVRSCSRCSIVWHFLPRASPRACRWNSTAPYAMTLLALVVTARAQHAPRALGRAFDGEVSLKRTGQIANCALSLF